MRAFLLFLLFSASLGAQPREDVYRADLIAFPGPWSFQIPKSAVILVSDQELEALSDPDHVLNLTLTHEPYQRSLRQICEAAHARGERTLIVAFDHFFRQYRPGQDQPRRLMPDMDEYIERIASIGRFAQQYGLGLELSLLSPLEIGKAYRARTGESGIWMHYREGLRDPGSGAFSVDLWQQQRWANNKGVIEIDDAGVRVFAFRETPVPGTPYRVVKPQEIVELTGDIRTEVFPGLVSRAGDYQARRVRVHGTISCATPGLDRVLVVQRYRTPEMDYFSPRALPFLTGIVDRYAQAGVRLNALYSDEMHIQQDWAYSAHHDAGQFALRYVSPGLEREYASRFGAEYGDFAKYLVYFAYGQEDFLNTLSARQPAMHVFGSSPAEIQRTALFRARYYRLLQDGVVDLFTAAKRHAESRMGHKLEARAHATWAESPTIDFWNAGSENHHRHQYEYTSNFIWSDTVHQAASACHDYFKWGDFLTGNGNDHTEGGYLDRDYFALALGCSTGILNEVPYSYAAHWGMPAEIARRRTALVDVYGAAGEPAYGLVQDMQHRDTEVLMLYPLDLVASEERFGSWMTQYGYANYITAAKLLERGKVNGSRIELAGRRFTTLVALFEPFPSRDLLAFMQRFAAQGGRLVWSGPPPLVTFEGEPALPAWQQIFGVELQPGGQIIAPGKIVRFEGPLAKVAPQTILTDFLVDWVYPVKPRPEATPVARVKDWIVGVANGSATFLGYRPRDDQSRSLGYDARNWFEVLSALGAYPAPDNPDRISRTGPYLAAAFPNGSVAIAPHLRELEEGWPGGFARDRKQDLAYLDRHPLPPESLWLRDFRVSGYVVTYEGEHAVALRAGKTGGLIAFAGENAREVTVNGRRTVFATAKMKRIAWAPVAAERRVEGGAVMQFLVDGSGTVRIPVPAWMNLIAEGPTPGSRGGAVPSRMEAGVLVFEATPALAGKWLYGVPR